MKADGANIFPSFPPISHPRNFFIPTPEDEEDATKVVAETNNDEGKADGEDVDVKGGGADHLGHIAEAKDLESDVEGGDDFGQRAGAQIGEHELLLGCLLPADDAVRRHDADIKPNNAVGCEEGQAGEGQRGKGVKI